MNIVIINHYAGGVPWGMEFRPYYLSRQWIKDGHKVIVVGASFSHLRSKQPLTSGNISREIVEGIDYVWVKTNSYQGNGIGRMLSMFTFVLKLFLFRRDILKAFIPDLIIASSTYPLDNYPVKWMANKYKALFCYEVHDLWPLSPMELGGYSKFHPFIQVMQRAENFAYKKADFVVSMLPKTLDHMVAHGLNPKKFCYVPNGISVDEGKSQTVPERVSNVLNMLKKQRKCIIGYVGGHAISNALDVLVDAALLASNTSPHLAFVLVGDGAEKRELIQQANQYRLTNIFFLEPIPKPAVASLLNDMDILYLGWRNRQIYRFGISPNKLLDYMMAAKPVVHSVNAGNDMVHESGCGISVVPENPEAIIQACNKISQLAAEQKYAMGLLGRTYVLRNNTYDVLAQRIINFAQQTQNDLKK